MCFSDACRRRIGTLLSALMLASVLVASVLVASVLVASVLAAPAFAQEAFAEHSLTVGREERTYLLSQPAGTAGPQPVVIALHGAGESTRGFLGYLGLEETAAKNRFTTVYPQGIGRVWNDGRPAAMRLKAVLTPGDDVAFLLALTQSLVAEGIADPNRIYLMGISNGGFMVERMACEHAELFAAYAVIMATAPANYREQCRPSRPVPIMFIHGTADAVIAWDGFWTPVGATLSAPDSAELFATLDGCGEATVRQLPDLDRFDGTTVSVRRWAPCAGAGEVALYRIERGGHQSPARVKTTDELATPFLGLRNRDIDAGAESWAFFSRFSLAPTAPALAAAKPSAQAAPAPVGVPLPVPSPLKGRSSSAAEPSVQR